MFIYRKNILLCVWKISHAQQMECELIQMNIQNTTFFLITLDTGFSITAVADTFFSIDRRQKYLPQK